LQLYTDYENLQPTACSHQQCLFGIIFEIRSKCDAISLEDIKIPITRSESCPNQLML
jgi:hypothetical protein